MAANGRGPDFLSGYANFKAIGEVFAKTIADPGICMPNSPAGGAMALELAVISLVAGIVLGLRYRVLILVPAVMLAMLFAILVGVAQAQSFWSVVLMTMALSVAVQMGYLAGVALRAGVEALCALLGRGRNPELSSLGPLWQQAWQLNSWHAPGAIARFRPPQRPRV